MCTCRLRCISVSVDGSRLSKLGSDSVFDVQRLLDAASMERRSQACK